MGGRKAPGEIGRADPCPSRDAVVKSVGVRWSLDDELKLELLDARDGVGLANAVNAGAEGIRFGLGGSVALLGRRFEADRLSLRDGGRLRSLFGSSGDLNPCRTVLPVATHGIDSTSDLAGSKSAVKASITSSIGGGGDGKLNSWQ